jgi:hypothetical protein
MPNTEDDKVEPRNPDHEPKDSESKPSENPRPHVKPSLETSTIHSPTNITSPLETTTNIPRVSRKGA